MSKKIAKRGFIPNGDWARAVQMEVCHGPEGMTSWRKYLVGWRPNSSPLFFETEAQTEWGALKEVIAFAKENGMKLPNTKEALCSARNKGGVLDEE